MFVREYFKCKTCGHPHVLRIGVGFEEREEHRFPCEDCGLEMAVALILDQKEGSSAYPEAVENAERIPRTESATVVNMHPNFVFPANERNREGSFAHLRQMKARFTAAEKRGGLVPVSSINPTRLNARPFRRPDYAGEWQHLRKAWRLHRNDREKLSVRELETISAIYHPDEPINDLPDAIWRFLVSITQPQYELHFANAFRQIDGIPKDHRFRDLLNYYDAEMLPGRADRYFSAMSDFFASYSEFGQVYFDVVAGVDIAPDHRTGSVNFDAVRMYYGNTFEALASSIDLLALANNLIAGREFNAFQSISIGDWLKTDKSARRNAFAMNAEFSALCTEWDNQLRNASHHGGVKFNAAQQRITYRAGKGGTGDESQLLYVEYLARSTKLFLQLMVMFRIEIALMHLTKGTMPI